MRSAFSSRGDFRPLRISRGQVSRAALLPALLAAAASGCRAPAAPAAGGDPQTRVVAPSVTAATRASARAQRRPRRLRPAQRSRPLVLSGGVLIDGTGAAPLGDAVVVVRGDRIAAVGQRGTLTLPADANMIDLAGATVLPGIINAHVHSGYSGGRATAWAHAGVIAVRDLCGPMAFGVVAEVNQDPRHSRIVAAGPFVTVPGGYPIVPWGTTNVVTVTTVEEARATVDALVDQGADLIKIALESGVDFGRSIPLLSPAQAAAIVDAAHARGIPVSAHVTVSTDLERALDAGVDDIAHMVIDSPSSALVNRAASADVTWVPTLELWRWVGWGHEPRAVANLRAFVRAGGTVALGTDYNGYDAPFQLGMPTVEMELMADAGMTPMEIIVAATANAAAVCNLAADLGTVEAGKLADLLVVGGDPLVDLDALTDVRLVLRNGVLIRDELSDL